MKGREPALRITRRTGVVAAIGAWLSGCSGAGVLDALVPGDSYEGRQAIAYGPLPRQQLDVYMPLTRHTAGPPPLVVFFYGGSWSRGDRADYRFVGEALAARGAVVVIPDYRLSPGVRYPVFVQDSAAAVKWAFDHAEELGASASNIVVMGHSAGAYNAAMLALDPRWLREAGLAPERRLAGWIGLAGPYDFLPIQQRETRIAFDWPETRPDSQPIEHVTPRAPRTLLLAASNDDVVDPQRNTVRLAALLRAAGVPTVMKLYGRVRHVSLLAALAKPLSWLAPVRPEVLAFLGLPSGD
jgi:acetyl esterase/lipase